MSSSFFRDDRDSTNRSSFSRSSSKDLRDADQFLRVFEVLLVFRLENFVLLFLAVRQPDIFRLLGGRHRRFMFVRAEAARPKPPEPSSSKARRTREMASSNPSLRYHTQHTNERCKHVGVIGLGNVGSGALSILAANADQIALKLGFPPARDGRLQPLGCR